MLLATPGTGVLQWVRDYAGENAVALLGDLALAAMLVPAGMRAALVDELFRSDPTLHCVVVQAPDGPVLVDRSWFEATITGRLGYGRLLHARKPILTLATLDTLVLAHDCTVEAAAAAVISRRTSGRAATAAVVAWPDGGVKIVLISAIFERLARQYAHQSWQDPLTQLPNRRYLREQIRVLEQARGAGDPTWQAVLLRLDVDRFTTINDALGHGAGDQILTQIAARLRTAARGDDLVVRLGGDEFAVLTAVPFTAAESDAFAARLVAECARELTVEIVDGTGGRTERVVSVSVSIGVAHTDDAAAGQLTSALDVLLTQADIAVHRAKRLGRGRTEHFRAELE